MKLYKATPSIQYPDQPAIEPVLFKSGTLSDARTWVINHLDVSYQWDVRFIERRDIKRSEFKFKPVPVVISTTILVATAYLWALIIIYQL